MKKYGVIRSAAFLMAGVLTLGLWGCGGTSSSSPGGEPTGAVVTPGESSETESPESTPSAPVYNINGWAVYDWEHPSDICDKAWNALRKAEERQGKGTYEEIALLATQIVAGTNYCIFCRKTLEGKMSYELVYVYQDLSGNADILSSQTIIEADRENYAVNEGDFNILSYEKACDAVREAIGNSGDDNEYYVIAYLGARTDVEEDYGVFCRVIDKTRKVPLYFAVLDIRRDGRGRMQIMENWEVPVGV